MAEVAPTPLAPRSSTGPGADKITGVLLAGGMGRRMGGVDKGLALLHGKTLACLVLERLAPQVSEVLVNANRNLENYARFGYRIISDGSAQLGPLSGVQAGLFEARHELLATVPCDCPYLPSDLVRRLHSALRTQRSEIAFAVASGRQQSTCCLYSRSVLPKLNRYLADGGRKVSAFHDTLSQAQVAFGNADEFTNINSSEALYALEESRY